MRTKSRKTVAKIAASVVLVGGAASVAGLGTYGSFTSSTSASAEVGAGQIQLVASEGVLGHKLPATGLVPGDSVQRTVTLTRGSDNESFGSVSLKTTGATANVLVSDATNGLQLAVDLCSTAWTISATNAKQLTCAGTVTPVVGSKAAVFTEADLTAATAALNTEAKVANLRVTLALPGTADNAFKGLTNTVGLEFIATQRAAESR